MSFDLTTIDLCKGEPSIIRENLVATFGLENTFFTTSLNKESSSYPPITGHLPLVKFLEDVYEAPVIITTGAKQSLAAVFYAMKKMGKKKLGYRKPYWCQIPALANRIGLESKSVRSDDPSEEYCDCYLSVMPCNPDGHIDGYGEHKYMGLAHKSFGIPFIHDAAYYHHIYLPDEYELGPVGDAQIFSASKMHGLSGLRIGYTVLYDVEIYQHMLDYIEHMSVGVSVPSQEVYLDVLRTIQSSQAKEREFTLKCRDDLYRAKFLARTINRDVLEVPDNVEHIPGMFLWAKVKNYRAFTAAKVNVANGTDFGCPGFIRMNLAANFDLLKEAITRINAFG